MSNPLIRPIAIYLPQFHPIAENNEWWGKGFTEWTNVAKSQPKFEGHYQPHLPADLGFYDLRLEEVRIAQAEMAKAAGIYGFCYYHYWFNGKRLLEKPFQAVLDSGKPDLPFMLCWANENWTRRWDGMDQQVLMKQDYSFEDDAAHMEYLCTAFRDERYIRVDGKPVFVVYRTGLFPDIKKTAEIWRQIARREGIGEIYLCRMESLATENVGVTIDPLSIGFDASVQFYPEKTFCPERNWGSAYDKLLHKLKVRPSPYLQNAVCEYKHVVKNAITLPQVKYKLYPCLTPGWDNSSRRKEKALIYHNSTPELYRQWLAHVVASFKPFSKEENFIFINAWNEWAEGNHLEPCQKWGDAYLQATRTVLEEHIAS